MSGSFQEVPSTGYLMCKLFHDSGRNPPDYIALIFIKTNAAFMLSPSVITPAMYLIKRKIFPHMRMPYHFMYFRRLLQKKRKWYLQYLRHFTFLENRQIVIKLLLHI